jgi:hypothetical protein
MDSNSMVVLLKGMLLLHIVADLDNRASCKMTMEDFKGLVSKLSVPLQEQDQGGTESHQINLQLLYPFQPGLAKSLISSIIDN